MIVSYAPNLSVTYDRKLRSQRFIVQATGGKLLHLFKQSQIQFFLILRVVHRK
jgi:hypothetical protein